MPILGLKLAGRHRETTDADTVKKTGWFNESIVVNS